MSEKEFIMRSIFETLGRITFVLMLLSILVGCSSGGSQPILPDENISQPGLTGEVEARETTKENGHYLLLYNLIYIDPENPDGPVVEVVPVRLGELHLNILKFLEVGPCTDCFKLVGFDFPEPGILDVDIEITHPFSDLIFTVFDVRGIMMFDANHIFPASGWTMSDYSMGDGALLNAEGYTRLYNGSTLGAAGDFFSYFNGKFATLAIPDADLNGFIRHITDDPANTRNALYPESSVTQTYSLALPSGEFVFGYAVDASWDMPDAVPVTDPMTDFPISAHCIEPWKVEITEEPVGDGLAPEGGETKLLIDVYDWQGSTTHAEPVLECSELFNDTRIAIWLEDSPVCSRYEVTVSNELLADVGDYSCLISVVANEYDPVGTWWLDLTAYQLQMLTVIEKFTENPVAVATADPNPQTAGLPVHFSGVDSYDPDGGDIQLYEWDWDNDGVYDETGEEADHAWPDPGTYPVQFRVIDDESETDELDVPLEIVINYIEVTSPNGGEKWQAGCNREIMWTSVNLTDTVFIDYSTDNFISDINSLATAEADDGSFMWENIPSDYSDTLRVRVSSTDDPSVNDVSDGDFSFVEVSGWEIKWGTSGSAVAVDTDGNIYVTGSTSGEALLAKFDSCGELQWEVTWGVGTGGGYGEGVTVDGFGNVYVAGWFFDTVDFNPGGGDPHTSNGQTDAFLSKFDSLGNYYGALTWGGEYNEEGSGVATDGSGNIYVTGFFEDIVDFDPGGGDPHESNGERDVFLSKFDSSGNFEWAHTWGGPAFDEGCGVAADGSGNVYVTGYFSATVDFDPDGGDPHTSNNIADVFLSKFDSSGNFEWARTWGDGCGYGVAADGSGNVYVAGFFWDIVDFDPGGGDPHTSNGEWDIFLSKFDSSGNFGWACTWGGADFDYGHGVAADGSGNVYVTGEFLGTVDFYPGGWIDYHSSHGKSDVFLSKFDSSGAYQWASTWGGEGSDAGYGVAADSSGNVYATTGIWGDNGAFLTKHLPDGSW